MRGLVEAGVGLSVVGRQHVDVVEHNTVEVGQFHRQAETDVHQSGFVEDVRERLFAIKEIVSTISAEQKQGTSQATLIMCTCNHTGKDK